ncbi:type II toxin-antitoxin system Phd/YefM family antitoxin [Micromonospora cathayae]|uniref:Type II toxin-antitoxin system prevent-host-death family antitoxin n=1 Tax=Micromonospora cathayae TaxID=3028804 RepID=A0ABY7ZQ15_9ACTN|nr:hypothetical protein [Micromonospora sp. HUAS 3]WDZ84521.1 hypothetical protein PVK37_29480 [Micromonospora sp. HUAS 3]
MPKPYPREFRDDVMRVARDREAGVTGRADREGFQDAPDDVVHVAAPEKADVDAGAVSGGETVEITDHGYPIARLVPAGDDRSTLTRLVVAGRAAAPTGSGPVPLPPKLGDETVEVVATLADMRDEERC